MLGVNTPYLYFGMWRATFAWHVEDMDLFSINYIHFGAPKFWYAVPQAKAVQLENSMRSKSESRPINFILIPLAFVSCIGYFANDTNQCRQFLRHKSFLASPPLLSQSSCKPNVLVQQAGEFVITCPRGYHAGFSLGFNCAESVNFALESWNEVEKHRHALVLVIGLLFCSSFHHYPHRVLLSAFALMLMHCSDNGRCKKQTGYVKLVLLAQQQLMQKAMDRPNIRESVKTLIVWCP